MPLHSRVYSKDGELGKRDDDFHSKPTRTQSTFLKPWRWRKRRLITVLAVVVLIYVFAANISTDLHTTGQGMGVTLQSNHGVQSSVTSNAPDGAPPRPTESVHSEEGRHYFNGPIKFYRLAMSLHAIARTMGSRPQNRNVLFAVSALKSASNLIPMACEMARWDRNYVHLALLGRDPLPLEDVLEINRVSKEDCSVYFHDARADFSEYSTDKRGEVAVTGAMKHINDFMHPQAIIMDDGNVEDAYFTRAMRSKAKELGRTLIEIPAGRYEDFLWMSRLDSGSLGSWFKPTIDILIHALPDSSGGLIRLVRSLENADYAGIKTPRLHVELPTDIEPFAKRYFERLEWPPSTSPSPIRDSTLTLRHRIPSTHVSSEQASIRFLESFYPTSTQDNHALILSPQDELSPLFLQYLHFVILEYKYSSYGSPASEELLGASLDVPTSYLNGTGIFKPPKIADMKAQKYKDPSQYDQKVPIQFLYQAPSATASLIFGDKWAMMHDFLTRRLASSHSGRADKTRKLVSEREPAWLEHLLELMRARGWNMLHPPTPFVTIHNELSRVPEEYLREKPEGQRAAEVLKQLDHPEEEPFLTASETPAIVEHIERDHADTLPLHEFLPLDGDLPELPHLPYLSHTGNLINISTASNMQKEYVKVFRRQIGGCEGTDATRQRIVHPLRTDDLFCLPGEDLEFNVELEQREKEVAEAIAHSTGEQKQVDRVHGEITSTPALIASVSLEETKVAETAKTKDER